MRKRFQAQEGSLSIPRFTREYEESLNEGLRELGMALAFDPYQADFFDMMEWEEEPRLSSVTSNKDIHGGFRTGTKAAAATSVEIRVESAPVVQMQVNRPFFLVSTMHIRRHCYLWKQ